MIIKCAWCQKKIGEKKPLKDKSVTHGMCDHCLAVTLRIAEFRKTYMGKPLLVRFADNG